MEIYVYRGAESLGTFTLKETTRYLSEGRLVETYKWFSLAITNGYTKSKPRKDALAKKITPEQITNAEALVKEMIEQNPKLIRKN